MKLPDSFLKLIDALAELPSIGPRQATRLAFYLMGRDQNSIQNLSRTIDELRKIKICERCFFIHQNSGALCDICENPGRRRDIIMIVEKETDLLSLENTGKFTGRYFILGPIPKTGFFQDWQKLRLQNLKSFIQKDLVSNIDHRTSNNGVAEEIILGFDPTTIGDFNASLLEKELKPFAKKISRLGRGLPTGGEIEFADDETLGSALEKRS